MRLWFLFCFVFAFALALNFRRKLQSVHTPLKESHLWSMKDFTPFELGCPAHSSSYYKLLFSFFRALTRNMQVPSTLYSCVSTHCPFRTLISRTEAFNWRAEGGRAEPKYKSPRNMCMRVGNLRAGETATCLQANRWESVISSAEQPSVPALLWLALCPVSCPLSVPPGWRLKSEVLFYLVCPPTPNSREGCQASNNRFFLSGPHPAAWPLATPPPHP